VQHITAQHSAHNIPHQNQVTELTAVIIRSLHCAEFVHAQHCTTSNTPLHLSRERIKPFAARSFFTPESFAFAHTTVLLEVRSKTGARKRAKPGDEIEPAAAGLSSVCPTLCLSSSLSVCVCLSVRLSLCQLPVCHLFVQPVVCLPFCLSVRLFVCASQLSVCHLFVQPSGCLPLCLSVRLLSCIYVCLSLSLCLSVCLSVFLSFCLSGFSLFVYLLSLSVCLLSVCLSACLSGWLAGWLSVCQAVYLAVCLTCWLAVR
jgi:hypothetical protein